MPTYVYRCEQCGNVIERRQRFTDARLTECEICQGQLQRVLQPVGIIFKGSGFYSTDHRAGSASAANGGGEKAERSSEERSESGESPPKPDAKSAESPASAPKEGAKESAKESGTASPSSSS